MTSFLRKVIKSIQGWKKQHFAEQKNEIYKKLLLGMTPEECLVMEDAQAGIDAATTGGFSSCYADKGVGKDRISF